MTATTPAAGTVSRGFRPDALRIGWSRGGLELKQFFRGRESVVFGLAFPVILLVIFGTIFSRDIAPGVSFTQYFVAGMIAAGLLTTSFQNLAIQIPIERDAGVLKRLAGTPMPKSAYFVGKVLMVAAVSALSAVLLLAIGVLFYGVELPSTAGKWFTFGWVGVLGVTACTLCGIAFSSLPRNGSSAPAIVTPVAIVLQFISGVFFVFTELPSWMQQIAAVFPLKWMAQGMRAVFLPDSFAAAEAAGSWELGRVALALVAWTVGGLVLCLLTFRWRSKEDG
ncbi:MAG TPA: ABC transporter permease [Cryptosporangiaceae bacterium]|nr:ABC transporter permease [Cryptosporangiaceae bacterium]